MNDSDRCPECGSWDRECVWESAKEGCGCARCLSASLERLKEIWAKERDQARAEVKAAFRAGYLRSDFVITGQQLIEIDAAWNRYQREQEQW